MSFYQKQVFLKYQSLTGVQYNLNLMDTPGHVDFSYEVSRSLAACEGSLLVVDATQGVEAQTLANVYQAIDNNHEIITVLNKIDLASADVERVKNQIEDELLDEQLEKTDIELLQTKSDQTLEWLYENQEENNDIYRINL